MALEVLVVDWRPPDFAGVADRFPEVSLHAVQSWEEAAPHLPAAEVLVTVGHGFTRDVAAQMPALRWLQSMISGTDRLLEGLADRPDVVLTNARGIHGPQMTEAALYHMLCLSRNVRRSVHAQDEHRYETWDPAVLEGRTVGIVGIGVIGEHLARTCKALGMTVVGVSRTQRRVDGIDRIVPRGQLAEAAAEVDFLVLTLPLDDDTRHIVDGRVLEAMKPTSFLVNLARGGHVETAALIDALRRGAIAGAGLDAFEEEPLPPEHPFWELDNVFVTAHMGGRTDRYVEGFLRLFEPNLRRWLDGGREALVNIVER
jgi:phosphoglycerate dehydrogenase-like enzyme